jgi:hypothetical protein
MHSTIGVKGSVLEKYRVMKEAGFEGVEPMGGMDREEVLAALKGNGSASRQRLLPYPLGEAALRAR